MTCGPVGLFTEDSVRSCGIAMHEEVALSLGMAPAAGRGFERNAEK